MAIFIVIIFTGIAYASVSDLISVDGLTRLGGDVNLQLVCTGITDNRNGTPLVPGPDGLATAAGHKGGISYNDGYEINLTVSFKNGEGNSSDPDYNANEWVKFDFIIKNNSNKVAVLLDNPVLVEVNTPLGYVSGGLKINNSGLTAVSAPFTVPVSGISLPSTLAVQSQTSIFSVTILWDKTGVPGANAMSGSLEFKIAIDFIKQ